MNFQRNCIVRELEARAPSSLRHESCQIMQGMFSPEKTTPQGKHYSVVDAVCNPKPLQPNLPLMIGGMTSASCLSSSPSMLLSMQRDSDTKDSINLTAKRPPRRRK